MEPDASERRHFASILRAFGHYAPWALAKVARTERQYEQALSPRQLQLLDLPGKIAGMRHAVHENARLLDMVVRAHLDHVGAAETALDKMVLAPHHAHTPCEMDMEKVQSTLKQFVREWGVEGQLEREAAHRPILEALARALPRGGHDGARVLVPGAGLGRLAWEAANLGYVVQASEFSYFMLIASNFILNAVHGHGGSVAVHPWVLQTCNSRTASDITRGCDVPDVAPWSLPPNARLSMCAGDFLEVYQEQAGCWEAVLSLFFLDTAHNPHEYIEAIARLLTVGGVWVNLGPLLWHFSDMPHEVSVELTWEETRQLIVDAGFVFEHEAWHTCPYVRNVRSMHTSQYECVCFVARWPGPAATNATERPNVATGT